MVVSINGGSLKGMVIIMGNPWKSHFNRWFRATSISGNFHMAMVHVAYSHGCDSDMLAAFFCAWCFLVFLVVFLTVPLWSSIFYFQTGCPAACCQLQCSLNRRRQQGTFFHANNVGEATESPVIQGPEIAPVQNKHSPIWNTSQKSPFSIGSTYFGIPDKSLIGGSSYRGVVALGEWWNPWCRTTLPTSIMAG